MRAKDNYFFCYFLYFFEANNNFNLCTGQRERLKMEGGAKIFKFLFLLNSIYNENKFLHNTPLFPYEIPSQTTRSISNLTIFF